MDEFMTGAGERDIWTCHDKWHVDAAIVKCTFCVGTIERFLGNGTWCAIIADNNNIGSV